MKIKKFLEGWKVGLNFLRYKDINFKKINSVQKSKNQCRNFLSGLLSVGL